jgi:hypothetical protein
MKSALLPLLPTLLLLTACDHRDDPAVVARQRECGVEAAAWFKREHPEITQETVDGAIRTTQRSFEDLLSADGHCHLIATEERSAAYADRPANGVIVRTLIDVKTGTVLGRVESPWPAKEGALLECQVAGHRCVSSQEWQRLAKDQ